jgi:leucyl aminopeptidase
MDFNIKTGQPEKLKADCLIIPVFEANKALELGVKLGKVTDTYLQDVFKLGDIQGKCAQTLLLPKVPGINCARILLVGCGAKSEFNDQKYRDVISKSITTLNGTGVSDAISYLTELNVPGRDAAWKAQQAVVTTLTALYKFTEFKSSKEKPKTVFKKITWIFANKREQGKAEVGVKTGLAISAGMQLTRDLANTPANICNPEYIAQTAKKLSKTYKTISTAILDRKDLEALKMGALIAVGKGSITPPKLITLEYRGATKSEHPIVLVGKGITFDTGGNSLKAPPNMIGMKFDMTGAATVLGLIKFAAELHLPLNIVGVLAVAENMPGPYASRPDDIVTTMAGITVEILNTDAEGRLVLADALTYSERFKPAIVIDIATLTGSIVMALGQAFSGLFSNHQPLADALLEASSVSGDKCWQMPLPEEYAKQLDSNVADIANVAGPEGGSIIAACFLSKFTKQYKWAHLDIAGSGCRWTGKERGATGQPIPLLAEYLLRTAGIGV